jgi:hypothetical protein
MRLRLVSAAVFVAMLPAAAGADSVVTYHNGNHRHGAYRIPSLTLAAAAHMQPDSKFKPSISGHIYAQPLFWKPKEANRGLVITATESNSVYALNENSGDTVWQIALAPSVPHSELPCGNIDPVGITGTPVIDQAAGVLYLDALTKTAKGARHKVYALSLSDGSVLPRWPIDLETALQKQGAHFSSPVQGERSALLLFANKLYVNYGGNFGDCGDYRGTVVQIDPDKAKVEANWQTRATGGGIWAQGGLAGDGAFLYITTGNTFGASSWSDGEAVIRLHPGLAHPRNNTKDFFTPSNWKDLDNSDQDLGGTEALPLNVAVSGDKPSARAIAFGKDGKAYLLNRKNLGGVGGAIQVLQASSGAVRTAPAIYETDAATMVTYTNSGNDHCAGSNIAALNVAAGGASPLSFAWCTPLIGGGAPIVTTTDGKANAIVWAVGAEGDNALHGFSAADGKIVFSGAGTAMNGLHHFQTILATRDRFYVAGDNNLYAFKWR